jgi:cytochrome oxidase Cu insertion factor (SCO1/SenC/PrrC family)
LVAIVKDIIEMRRKSFPVIATLVLFLLAACSANQEQEIVTQQAEPAAAAVETQVDNNPESTDENSAEPDPASDRQETQTESQVDVVAPSEENPASADSSSASGTERPAWQHLALTNARTGESFTLADFEGKTIFVEPMATWCSNCRQQLNNVRDAKFQLDADEVVFIALSLETNIADETLAQYANGSSYDWLFAVATPDLLKGLTEEFGRAIVVAPSTPHFIIRADGTNSELVTGIEPAGQIVAQIQAAQG